MARSQTFRFAQRILNIKTITITLINQHSPAVTNAVLILRRAEANFIRNRDRKLVLQQQAIALGALIKVEPSGSWVAVTASASIQAWAGVNGSLVKLNAIADHPSGVMSN